MNARETAFVNAYKAGPTRGNATKSAEAAGYSPQSAYSQGHRLLKKAEIAAALEEQQTEETKAAIADAAELDSILTNIARNSLEERDRVAAVRELNKVAGRHVTRLADADGKPLNFNVVTNVPQPE